MWAAHHHHPVVDAASFYVNPFTAYAIVETARSRGAKGFVHTGACSQLGQMLTKYVASQATDMTVLHLVRRAEQAETLRDLGAQHVLVTSGDGWKAELKETIARLQLTMAFDCACSIVRAQDPAKGHLRMPNQSIRHN